MNNKHANEPVHPREQRGARLLRPRRLLRVLTCVGVLAGMAGHLRAATYVVDQAAPGAADTNPGTGEQPFKTVQHAADIAKPGNTVYVMAGQYDERVRVRTGGMEGQPVAFVAMPRRSATVGGFDLGASYIRVEGFEITAGLPPPSNCAPATAKSSTTTSTT